MPIILALDPATKTGWCIGKPGEQPRLGMVNFGERDGGDQFDIFARAQRWIDIQLGPDAIHGVPNLLAIERPVPPSQKFGSTNFNTTGIALGLYAIFTGAARAKGIKRWCCCYDNVDNIKILPAHISSWRKYALSAGNLSGRDAKRGMVRLVKGLGWGEHDHNACEAAGVWLWACGQVAPERVLRHEPLFSGVPV